MEPDLDREFQRGVDEATADVAAGQCRFFFQTRGSWGQFFTDLMRERFGVQVVHTSDITNSYEIAYERGYNNTVEAHLDHAFGAGAYRKAWKEVQEYRRESYRTWRPPTNDT